MRARSCDGLSVTNAMPVLGALTKPLIDSPGKATEFATPGMRQRERRHLANDALRAIQRRAVGQLRERDQVVLVLRRDEALRHLA